MLGSKESFKEASEDMLEHYGIEISPKEVMRITERIGREWEKQREQEVEAFKGGKLGRGCCTAPPVAAVMVDAGRLQTRAEDARAGVHDPQWRAPRYACCISMASEEHDSDPQPEPPGKFTDREEVKRLAEELRNRAAGGAGTEAAGGRAEVRRGGEEGVRRRRRRKRGAGRGAGRSAVRRTDRVELVRTVIGTMRGAEEFGWMVAAEVHRRCLDLACRKAYVCDGEAANWKIHWEHFRERGFVPILDFIHLLGRLYKAAMAAGGGEGGGWGLYLRWMRLAWTGRREKLLLELREASRRAGEPPEGAGEGDARVILKRAVGYVENNLERMDYPRYRKLGLPIMSAPVESAIKRFNRRMKGTEKFWVERGAEAVLQVRAAYLSEDGRAERYWNMPRPRYRAVGRNRLALAS
ncbi:MAG: hypothetical protein N3A38_11365 [Planctomycetota bacterium]|nr:hypothetical protein [Planctomycetota bacterium]